MDNEVIDRSEEGEPYYLSWQKTAIKEYLAGEYSFFPVAEISEKEVELFTCKLY